MKLIYRILIRLSLTLTVILAVWGFFFYTAIIDEINDESDDSLEDYSENIITRALSDQIFPNHSDGSNNSYFLTEVSRAYAEHTPHIRYSDEMIYITEKKETEPARVLRTIFKDKKNRYYELTVSTPTIEKEDLQEAILNWVIVLYFTLLIIILIINVWVYYGSMKPLYILLKWLDQYTIGRKDTPPDLKTDITEFRKLSEAARKSTQRNQMIFEQQKQFIGNASHELQTPLAICQNRLEMLSESELNEEQLQEIMKIQQTLSYIIRLNKSLLFLSKIENRQFQDAKEICLNDLVHRQLEDYQEIYSYKNITTQVEEKDRLCIQMNDTLATSLITNLLKNAYFHNIPQGEILILIDERHLTFVNTGQAKALEKDRFSKRFYQGKSVNSESSGLGLSIVTAICKMYHINLKYIYQDTTHRFELIFPAKDFPKSTDLP